MADIQMDLTFRSSGTPPNITLHAEDARGEIVGQIIINVNRHEVAAKLVGELTKRLTSG